MGMILKIFSKSFAGSDFRTKLDIDSDTFPNWSCWKLTFKGSKRLIDAFKILDELHFDFRLYL